MCVLLQAKSSGSPSIQFLGNEGVSVCALLVVVQERVRGGGSKSRDQQEMECLRLAKFSCFFFLYQLPLVSLDNSIMDTD